MNDEQIIVIVDREAWKPDVLATAVDPGGHLVAFHVSSSDGWTRHDIGRKLPEDAEQIWVEVGDDRIPEPCGGCVECAADGEGT